LEKNKKLHRSLFQFFLKMDGSTSARPLFLPPRKICDFILLFKKEGVGEHFGEKIMSLAPIVTEIWRFAIWSFGPEKPI